MNRRRLFSYRLPATSSRWRIAEMLVACNDSDRRPLCCRLRTPHVRLRGHHNMPCYRALESHCNRQAIAFTLNPPNQDRQAKAQIGQFETDSWESPMLEHNYRGLHQSVLFEVSPIAAVPRSTAASYRSL